MPQKNRQPDRLSPEVEALIANVGYCRQLHTFIAEQSAKERPDVRMPLDLLDDAVRVLDELYAPIRNLKDLSSYRPGIASADQLHDKATKVAEDSLYFVLEAFGRVPFREYDNLGIQELLGLSSGQIVYRCVAKNNPWAIGPRWVGEKDSAMIIRGGGSVFPAQPSFVLESILFSKRDHPSEQLKIPLDDDDEHRISATSQGNNFQIILKGENALMRPYDIHPVCFSKVLSPFYVRRDDPLGRLIQYVMSPVALMYGTVTFNLFYAHEFTPDSWTSTQEHLDLKMILQGKSSRLDMEPGYTPPLALNWIKEKEGTTAKHVYAAFADPTLSFRDLITMFVHVGPVPEKVARDYIESCRDPIRNMMAGK